MVLLSQPSKVHEMNTYEVDANLAYCLSQAFFFFWLNLSFSSLLMCVSVYLILFLKLSVYMN